MAIEVSDQMTTEWTARDPNSSVRIDAGHIRSSPELANLGSYLKSVIQLGKITHEALYLYTAGTARESCKQKYVILHESED